MPSNDDNIEVEYILNKLVWVKIRKGYHRVSNSNSNSNSTSMRVIPTRSIQRKKQKEVGEQEEKYGPNYIPERRLDFDDL